MSEGDREIRLKISASPGVGGVWQDGDVKVAVWAVSALRSRAEDHQDGDAWQIAGCLQDLFVKG